MIKWGNCDNLTVSFKPFVIGEINLREIWCEGRNKSEILKFDLNKILVKNKSILDSYDFASERIDESCYLRRENKSAFSLRQDRSFERLTIASSRCFSMIDSNSALQSHAFFRFLTTELSLVSKWNIDASSTDESRVMGEKSDNLSCLSTVWRLPGERASEHRGHRPTSDRRGCPSRPRCPGPARRSRRRFLWWPDDGRWWCTFCPAWLCPGPPAQPARRKCQINAIVCFFGDTS